MFALLFFILILSFSLCSKPSISDINIMLPICKSSNIQNCNFVHHSIYGSNGCFDWELSNTSSESFIKIKKERVYSDNSQQNNICFNKLIVFTNININPEQYIYINAIETISFQKFKIKVGFSYINKLSVIKRLDTMNVGEILQLNVVAEDINNNTFSSLEGYSFEWSLKSKNTNFKVAEIKKLSNMYNHLSYYNDSNSSIRLKTEEKSFSDIVYINGLSTGIVDVKVLLKEPGYSNEIISLAKEIIIKQEFEVCPIELWILPNSSFEYDINLIKEDFGSESSAKLNEASGIYKLENNYLLSKSEYKNYSFNLKDNKCGSFSKDIINPNIYLSSDIECKNYVKVYDKRLQDINKAYSAINIVYPDSIDTFYIEISENINKEFNIDYRFSYEKIMESIAHNNYTFLNSFYKYLINKNNIINSFSNNKKWNLESGKKYLIVNYVKYNHHLVYYNLNKLKLLNDYSDLIKDKKINIISESKSGQFLIINTLESTVNKQNQKEYSISSTINSNSFSIESNSNVFKNIINYSSQKNILIFDPVKIIKYNQTKFFLPYLGEFKSQPLILNIEGGSGNYSLISSNTNIVYIEKNVLYGKNEGSTIIKLIDNIIDSKYNEDKNNEIEVEVIKINSLSSVNTYHEAEILPNNKYNEFNELNKKHLAEVSMIGLFDNFNIFTNCSSLYINEFNNNIEYNDNNNNNNNINLLYNLNNDIKNNNLNTKKLMKTIENMNIRNINSDYLEYSNYGLCNYSNIASVKKCITSLTHATIKLNDKDSFKVPIINNPKIQFYSKLIQIYPYIYSNDMITTKLLESGDNYNKSDFVNNKRIENNIVLSVDSEIDLIFEGGIQPWNSSFYTELDYKVNRLKENINVKLINENNDISVFKQKEENYSINSYPFSIKTILDNSKEYKSLRIICKDFSKDSFLIKIYTYNNYKEEFENGSYCNYYFILRCTYPTYMSIILEENNNIVSSSNQLFSIPQNKGIKYLKPINSTFSIRIYAIDEYKNLLINFKGIDPSEKLIKDLNKLNNNIDIDLLQNKLYYVTYNIKIKEKEEDSLVMYSFIPKMTRKDVNHNIIISAFNSASIVPNYAKLFLHENNVYELDIINGSGDFNYNLSDPSIAKLEVKGRKLLIIPLKIGHTFIYLKDNVFNNNDYVNLAKIEVNQIGDIVLMSPSNLIVGNEVKGLIKVYDNYNNEFSKEEIKKMNFTVKYNKVNNNNCIEIEKNSVIDYITIKGLNEGNQEFYVSSDYISNNNNKKHVYKSNIINITVHNKLEVFPPNLLLYPGSTFTLKILGGPFSNLKLNNNNNSIDSNEYYLKKSYLVEEDDIASIDEIVPKVTAKKIGSTIINIIIKYEPEENQFYNLSNHNEYYRYLKETIFDTLNVPVQVAIPDSIDIEYANNRKVYKNSSIRLLSIIKLKDRSFTYGIGDIEYNWSVDNPNVAIFNTQKEFSCNMLIECTNNSSLCKSSSDSKEIAKLNNSNNECLSKSIDNNIRSNNSDYNEVGSFIKTLNNGNVIVKLNILIKYPEYYSTLRPNTFTIKKEINVEENIWIDISEYYNNDSNKSSLYLLPHNITHHLKPHQTNQITKFSILNQSTDNIINNNILNLTEDGRVTTYNKSGLVNILIKKNYYNDLKSENSNKYSNIEVPTVLNLFVTDYYSIFAENSQKVVIMESGKNIELKLAVQHESGLMFAERYNNIDLTIIESNPKSAYAEFSSNYSTIKVYAYNPGESNIIIFKKSSKKILDVFRVSVESSLDIPSEFNLLIGSTVKLFNYDEKKLSYIKNLDAMWFSSNNSIVSIDKNGYLVALKEGSSVITLENLSRTQMYLKSDIIVSSFNMIRSELDNLPSYITKNKNNSQFQYEYRFPFKYVVYNKNMIIETTKKEISSNNNSAYNQHYIKLNVESKCYLNSKSVLFKELIVENNLNKNSCIVKFKDLKDDLVNNDINKIFNSNNENNIIINIKSTLKAQSSQYFEESSINIVYHPGLLTKEYDEISLDKYNKEYNVKILKPHNLNNIIIDNPSPNFVDIDILDRKGNIVDYSLPYKKEINSVRIKVKDNLNNNFETTFNIKDAVLNDTQNIKIKYNHNNSTTKMTKILNLIFYSMILVFFVLLLLWCYGDEEKVTRKSYNFKAPGGSKGYIRLNQD